MLIIQPSGGLCNRMRVINSGMELANRKHTPLTVLWYCCPELNCPFEEIFMPQNEFKLITIYSLKDMKKLFLQFTARTRITNADIENHTISGTLDENYSKKIHLPAYIFTWEHFYPSKDYHLFVPSNSVSERISEIKQDFSSYTVGVHIRRTDQSVSIGTSKTSDFIALMEKECLANPHVMFYLATDDRKEEAYLRDHFPGHIISNKNRSLDRNSPDGIKDAMVDLYALASTKKLFGSYYSSFTDIAADLYKIPKIIAGVDDYA